MTNVRKTTVIYVTSSPFKIEENRIFHDRCTLDDGTPVKDLFEFNVRKLQIGEMLEVNLEVLVQAEVVEAYRQVKRPCIVEHAGLIFDDYLPDSYPGGLTKPMWNTLRDRFLEETNSKGRRALARAVVAYCDGKQVQTFVGETSGVLAKRPSGKREFYWDTVFIPDDPSGKSTGKTFAEIVEDTSLGLEYKMVNLSQSGKAMLKLLSYLRTNPIADLWR